MPQNFGLSFVPGQDAAGQRTAQGQERPRASPVQESVQTMRMRLPKVFGARAPIDRSLMNGMGGGGQWGGGGGLVAQALATLAGVSPRPRTPEPVRSPVAPRLPIQHMGSGSASALGGGGGGSAPPPQYPSAASFNPSAAFTQPLPVNIGFPYPTTPPVLPMPGPVMPPPRQMMPTPPLPGPAPHPGQDFMTDWQAPGVIDWSLIP